MNTKKTITVTYRLLRAVMILFWVYVGIEKIWQLEAFRIALQQQPVIGGLASLLFWLLPTLEIATGTMLALPTSKAQRWGWHTSLFLITVFTVYIGLGLLDAYAQKPCMCTSFLSRVSWAVHLFINLVILGLALLGRVLQRSSSDSAPTAGSGRTNMIILLLVSLISITAYNYKNTISYQNHWYLSDSIYYYPAYDNVMGPIVGNMANRYDRYLGLYWQPLFIQNIRRSTELTNIVLTCERERRVALC